MTATQLALLTLVLLAAFVLRMATLDRRPLHFDEGNSVYFARLSLPQLLQASIDNHEADPPGYRQTLGAWISLAGPAPVSIRLYSILYSLLALAAMVALLREMRLPFVPCLAAALLLAGSAFAIDYAQQAKGYAMGAAMAMLSWWSWVRMTRRRAPGSVFVIYVLSTLLMLSTHYYTAAVLAMQWLWYFARPHRREAWRPVRFLILAQFLACLPIAVWTVLAIHGILTGANGLSVATQVASPFALFLDILKEMSAGQFADATLAGVAVAISGLAAAAGGYRLWRAGQRGVFWFGVSIIVPITGALVMQQRITFFSPRFVLYAMPCLCALIAGLSLPPVRPAVGAHGLAVAPTVGIAAVALVAIAANITFARAPVDSANDFRPLVAAIRPDIRPGDAALGSFIWMEGMLTSYAPESQGQVTWYNDFYTPGNLNALMAPIATAHHRVWSFNYARDPDAPQTLSVQWLKSHATYAARFSAGTLSTLLFDAAGGLQDNTIPQKARFEKGITLSFQPLEARAHPGDTVVVALAWSADRPVAEHDMVFLHLRSADGSLAAQNDGDAVNGLAPSFTWQPDTVVQDRRALLIPGNLPPGEYVLEAGLYLAGNGQRLLTDTGADAVHLGSIIVAR